MLVAAGCVDAPASGAGSPDTGLATTRGGTSGDGSSSESGPEPDDATGSQEATSDGGSTGMDAPKLDVGSPDGTEPPCEVDGPVPPPLGAAGVLAEPFSSLYTAHDLGTIDGVLDPLGGTILALDDDDTMIVIGASETTGAALYDVPVQRDNCGHIVSLGAGVLREQVPFADTNMVHAPGGLVVSQFPIAQIAQQRAQGWVSADLTTLGVDGPYENHRAYSESPGGLGIVPAWLGAAGEFRTVAYPTGQWYRLEHELVDGAIEFTGATPTVVLENGAGGFAYVPPDSPGFEGPSLIVSEWFFGPYEPSEGSGSPANPLDPQRVAVYEVDEHGDPLLATRRDFFSSFDRPWGAYFDPVSGDFLFLEWKSEAGRVAQVRGFNPPPAG